MKLPSPTIGTPSLPVHGPDDIVIYMHFQLQLCVSTSSWSEGFSLDTVGSYGCVKCPASNMDYLVRHSGSVIDLLCLAIVIRLVMAFVVIDDVTSSYRWASASR